MGPLDDQVRPTGKKSNIVPVRVRKEVWTTLCCQAFVARDVKELNVDLIIEAA